MTEQEILDGNKLIAEKLCDYGYKINKDGTVIGKRGNKLKLHMGTSGYIQLNIGKPTKSYLVHRLVAQLYLPNPSNLPEVNHKDGNKLNNNVENLEWVSRSQNIIHGIYNNLIPSPWKGKLGKYHIRSKRVYQIIDNIIVNEFGSAREASRETGINYGTISNVLIGRGKTAGGYVWKYNI